MASFNYLLGRVPIGSTCLWQPIRCKPKVHWNVKKLKSSPTKIALQHFDTFYNRVYQNRWQSIRLGLLSANKYMAIVNNFADSESIEVDLRLLGAQNLRHIYERNLKKLTKKAELKQFLKDRREQRSDGKVVPDLAKSILQPSDSETDDIASLLTDSDSEPSDSFINEASFDLNLNDFIPVSELNYQEEISTETDYYSFYDLSDEVDVKRIEQESLEWPLLLNLYTFGRNDFRTFPAPKLSKSNLFDYYLIDGASALPALLLDIRDGDYVGDFCAAPGGKSLLLFFTFKRCHFLLNDQSASRFARLKRVYDSFVPNSKQATIEFQNQDACQLKKYDSFDKILLDVPCTNDRHSLYVEANNMFATKRTRERIEIPYRQLDLLFESLKCLKPGGTLVYSTCSLSPIQNDGVVHMALKRVWQETRLEFAVIDVSRILKPFKTIYRLNHRLRYGTQVEPFLPSNYGPMYFAKLTRIK